MYKEIHLTFKSKANLNKADLAAWIFAKFDSLRSLKYLKVWAKFEEL